MATINGAHVIIYSTNADADRAFFQDVLSLPSADAGGGWVIFGLPPAEVAVHPSEYDSSHELYLMCDDIEVFLSELGQRNIACGEVQDQGWGLVSEIILPGGGKLPVYQPRHPRPEPAPGPATRSPRAKASRAKASRVKPGAKKTAKAGKTRKASKKAAAPAKQVARGKATPKKRKR
jgi:hypothetical protein